METITFGQVIEWAKNLTWIVVILGVFIEIVPIKIHPILWLMNAILKPIRDEICNIKKELNDKIDETKNTLSEKIDKVESKQLEEEQKIVELIQAQEMDSISRIRWEILEFSNSIQNGQLHTRDEYLNIRDNYSRYHHLIEKNRMTNGLLDEEMKKINEHYEDNKNSNEFYI